MSETVVHVRAIRMEARRVGDEELEVQGSLVDERPDGAPRWFSEERGTEVHNMTVTLRVSYPDFTITGISARMATYPYTICPEASQPLQQLVGVSVAHGFNRAVLERIGREKGCAHLTSLILAMGPVVKQGAGAAFRGEKRIPTDTDSLWFINTCHAWLKDGPLHSFLKTGNIEGIKAMSARPRQPGDNTISKE
jgi:hypothetical protein